MASLIKLPSVEKMVGLKKSKVYALIQQGAFPRPVKIGRSSSWVESEIEQWIVEHANLRTSSTDVRVCH